MLSGFECRVKCDLREIKLQERIGYFLRSDSGQGEAAGIENSPGKTDQNA